MKIQRKKIQIDLFVSKSCGYDPVLFKDMPKSIVDYVKTIQVHDDICVQWIYDLIQIES